MKSPLLGAFQAPKTEQHTLGPIQRIESPMRHYDLDDEVDFAIVGVGAGGGVLAQRLARAGFRVVAFDAGPFWDVERDWVSDEAGSHQLYWTEPRITGGRNPLTLGSNNSGQGVGGSTVHWAAFAPRLHPSDFRTHSQDGVGVDWPITYDDLRPYYEIMEKELPVSGPAYYPWGDPHGYLYGPHPMGGVGDILAKGCDRLGIRYVAGGPVAINAGSHGSRPHCIYRGFCIQGCKVGAKASTLYTHVPDAIANGAEIRANCMVFRVNMSGEGTCTGVSYFDDQKRERTQKARCVAVCGYSIETPRLLLLSACPGFENPVRMYKAPPAHALTEEFYETDRARGFARGFAIQTVGPEPMAFAKQMMMAKGAWGWGMREVMMDYNHYAPLGFLGEILPHAENRVTLSSVRDRYGLPVADVEFGLQENDKQLIRWGVNKTKEVMWAAGAEEVVEEPRYAHLVGACRMGSDPKTSVCDSFGRTHDIPNLFLVDGSIMPTQGSANPGLTVMALAARAADYIITERVNVLSRQRPHYPVASVPVRRELAPPETAGRGVPRMKSATPKKRLGLGGLAIGTKHQ